MPELLELLELPEKPEEDPPQLSPELLWPDEPPLECPPPPL
ncbi:MAG: hypothetical protein ACKN9T_12090 [Candidatus Methylumidiphilus sp.]